METEHDVKDPVGRFGVTIEEVNHLFRNVTIRNGAADALGRPYRDGVTYVTAQDVHQWIESVTSRVIARIPVITKIRPDTTLHTLVTEAGHDIVLNGAGSYTYAAAGPEKASLNDTTSYAEVLWRRFTEGLDELEEAFKRWRRLYPDDLDDNEPTGGLGSGRFPCPAFRDGMRW